MSKMCKQQFEVRKDVISKTEVVFSNDKNDMDFVSFMRYQCEKLENREYQTRLWKQIKGTASSNDDEEIDESTVDRYVNHLPLIPEQFWNDAVLKCAQDDFECSEIDHTLKTYILTLLYYSTNTRNESISFGIAMCASEVYLQLCNCVQGDEFFHSKIYMSVLTLLNASAEQTSLQHLPNGLIKVFRKFLVNRRQLELEELQATLGVLSQILFMKTTSAYRHFPLDSETESVSHNILLALKALIINETVPSRKRMLITYLFLGLKQVKVHLNMHSTKLIQSNYNNLMRDLDDVFEQDKYSTFLNAFIQSWLHNDFFYFDDAIIIMNNLKGEYYRQLIDTINKMVMSKFCHKNLFRMMLAIINNPVKTNNTEKINTCNIIFIRNMLLNCLAKQIDISNAAIECLANLITSLYLQKTERIISTFRDIINNPHDNILNVPTILQGLRSLIRRNWTANRMKQKNVFIITLGVIGYSYEDHFGVYSDILDVLSGEASAFDMKPLLPILSATYLKLCKKEFTFSSKLILKILYKMAMHQMATSADFLRYLYSAMIPPVNDESTNDKSHLFIDPIISSDFNFDEFFRKCNILGLIKTEHASKLIGTNVEQMSCSHWKLLCAIIEHSNYRNLTIFANYVNSNYEDLYKDPNVNYIFYIYKKIVEKCTKTSGTEWNRCNTIMHKFLKQYLLEQKFKWAIVPNAFALFKTLVDLNKSNNTCTEDFTTLKREYDNKLSEALNKKNDFMPILYFSQLVLFVNMEPNTENAKKIINHLKQFTKQTDSIDEKEAEIWIALLYLMTCISIINNNLVDLTITCLEKALISHITNVKLAAINMFFDLSNLITHNFDDLVNKMFKEIVAGDIVFKQTCITKIDQLIRNDYLILDLKQYLMFICILGDKNYGLDDYMNQLLTENFFVTNTGIIAKYFLPLILYINQYRKHPLYELSNPDYESVKVLTSKVHDKMKLYSILLSHLPNKSIFNIINTVSVHILDKLIKHRIQNDDEGFWPMIKDCILLYKMVSKDKRGEVTYREYYKKVFVQISKYLCQTHKKSFDEKPQYTEYHRIIRQSTLTLIKLLFFSEDGTVQMHITMVTFMAIIHWTDYLFADLSYLVQAETCKELSEAYRKLEVFFKENASILKFGEEQSPSSSNENQIETIQWLSSNQTPSQFSSTGNENYVPELEN